MAAAASRDPSIVIAGTGFAGLAMAIRLKQAGITDFIIIEKASEIGGTWRDNHYPGAACDIPSHLYSLSFEPKPDWSRMYPGHAELQAYLLGLVEKHGLRAKIRFNTILREAAYDEAAGLWQIGFDNGARIEARVLISAVGALHEPGVPHLPGIETFEGKAFHSAAWDHDYDLTGKRIAVIGTGASAIQFVPQIAPAAAKLSVFQRTAPWINPKRDYLLSPRKKWLMAHVPLYRRLVRWRLFWLHEIRVAGFLGRFKLLEWGENFANSYRTRKIADPVLRAKLTPDYRLGCKRVLISNDYYSTFARGEAGLVTSAIASVKPNAIETADGVIHPIDTIIYGTGFKATSTARYGHIRGLGGLELSEAWQRSGNVFLGIAIAGFPNYFMLLGPNTGLGHNSVVLMIEAQVRYIVSALTQMRRRNLRAVSVRGEVAAQFSQWLEARMAKTIWQRGGCRSWYQDETGRNTTMWPGSVVTYIVKTRRASLSDFNLLEDRSPHG